MKNVILAKIYKCLDLQVSSLESVHIGLHGLGPFNWIGKRVILGMVRDNIRQVVENKAREIVNNQLLSFSIVEQISHIILPGARQA